MLPSIHAWAESVLLWLLVLGSSLMLICIKPKPPADFWCEMQFAFLFVKAPLKRGEALSWRTFHAFRFCQLLAGPIQLHRSEDSELHISSRDLFFFFFMNCIRHGSHWICRRRRLRVLVCGYIYLYVCLSVSYCVGGGYTRTCTSVSVWYASSQHAAERKKKPFLYFPIPPKSSYISAVVLPLTKLLASPTE